MRVAVNVGPRPYDVVIESGLLRRAGALIARAIGRQPSVFVVTVPPVRRAWGRVLARALQAAGLEAAWLEMPDGERAKKLATVEKLAARLVALGADRGALIVALGGGVAGDTAGLLAALYMRGVDLVQVPTTLLAQVDAAIGGKTGVNLAAGKNLVGAFHQPRLVLVDPETLRTLPERQYRAGLFEALKCGVIRDPQIFRFMEQERARLLRRDPEALEWLIAACVRVKADVVAADERESDLRRILNFGHTIGHALEAETAYRRLLHGEAVAWGMIAAASIARATGRAAAPTAQRIIAGVLAYGPLPRVSVSPGRVLRLLRADKKTAGGVVHFVLPRRIGEVEIAADVPDPAITQALMELRRLSKA